jgi:hypothetical protein
VISLQSGDISIAFHTKRLGFYQEHEKMSSFKIAKGCEEFGLQDWPVCWSAELLHPKLPTCFQFVSRNNNEGQSPP